jgi:hypothetical protein
MNCYMALRLDENGKVKWSPSELQKWEKFKQIYKGRSIEMQVGELSPLRTDEHMKFVRMKIGHICKYTGYRSGEMLDLLMESLGLGKSNEPKNPDLVAVFFVRFRRMSTTRLTKAHVNAMSDRLDELKDWLNELRPDQWINWPERVERAKKLLATEEEAKPGPAPENVSWKDAAAAAAEPGIKFPVSENEAPEFLSA